MGTSERSEHNELALRRHAAEARERILGFWRAQALSDSESLRISLALQTYERERAKQVGGGGALTEVSGPAILDELATRLAPDLARRLVAAARGPRAEPPAPPAHSGAEVRERFGDRKDSRWSQAEPAPQEAEAPEPGAERDLGPAAETTAPQEPTALDQWLVSEPTVPAAETTGRVSIPSAVGEDATAPPPAQKKTAPPPRPRAPRPKTEWGRILDTLREAGSTAVLLGVATLLVIGGSLALTLYFWNEFEAAPLIASLGVTGMFFTAGAFLRKRLQIVRTGNTLLCIGMLLVPASLLAARALALGTAPLLGALAVLLPAVWFSARLLFTRDWLAPTITYCASSALLALFDPNHLPPAGAVIVPILIAVVGLAVDLAHRRRVAASADTYARLGVETLLAFGLTAYVTLFLPLEAVLGAGVQLPPILMVLVLLLAAAPALFHGAFLMKLESASTGLRTVGTALVLGGAAGFACVSLVTQGQGEPLGVWAVATTIAMAGAARLTGLEILHAGTVLAATVAHVTGVHLVVGWMGAGFNWNIPDPEHTALWCIPLAIAFGVVGSRLQGSVSRRVFAAAAGLLSLVTMVISLKAPDTTAGCFGLYGVIALALVRLGARPALALVGPVFLAFAGTAAWFHLYRGPQLEDSLWIAGVICSGLAFLVAAPARRLSAFLCGTREDSVAWLEAAFGRLACTLAAIAWIFPLAAVADGDWVPRLDLLPGAIALLAVAAATARRGGHGKLLLFAAMAHVELVLAVVRPLRDETTLSTVAFALSGLALLLALSARLAGGFLDRRAGGTLPEAPLPARIAGHGLTLIRIATASAFLATTVACLAVVIDDLQLGQTIAGVAIVATLALAGYLADSPWRSFAACVGVFWTALQAYGLTAGSEHLWVHDQGFRSVTLGIASALLAGGLVLRGIERLRRVFAEPALISSVLACAAPLVANLLPLFDGQRAPARIDMGILVIVSAIVYAAALGLPSTTLVSVGTFLLVMSGLQSGWIAGHGMVATELAIPLLAHTLAASFVLTLAGTLWRGAGGALEPIRDSFRDLGRFALAACTILGIALAVFVLAGAIIDVSDPLPVSRHAAWLLLGALTAGALPLARPSRAVKLPTVKPPTEGPVAEPEATGSWQGGVDTLQVVSGITTVLWMQFALWGDASLDYTKLASAAVVGALALWISWRKQDHLLPVLVVMTVLTAAVGWVHPWTPASAASWGILATLLLFASRRPERASVLYGTGALLSAFAIVATVAWAATPLGSACMLMATVMALSAAGLLRPWGWLAGDRPESAQVALAHAAASAATAVVAGSALLQIGDAGTTALPWLIRLGFLAGILGVTAVSFLEARRTENEPLVYAGIAVLGGLGLAVRLSLPELFGHGFFARWWPYLSVGVGLLASVVAGWLERTSHTVFVRPFRHVGIFLPLAPLVGIWFFPPAGAASPADQAASRAVILATVSIFYFVIGVLQRRPALVGLAALVANLALGSLWYYFGFDLEQVPQLFAIPLGLTIVLAARLQRDSLGEQTADGLTYLGLLVIYLAGAWKLFSAGGMHSIALAVVSIAGIFFGLITRMRPVLYTGLVFLAATVLAELTRAASEHPWLWWAFGIGTGIGILVFVGWNENRKQKERTTPPTE